MDHELGHVLGLDDFHDAKGNETDSPGPTVMGAYTGTNNQGFPPTNNVPAAPPGHVVPITPCDVATVLGNQKTPPPSDGGGSVHHPLSYVPAPDSGSGTGGFDWNDVTQTAVSFRIVDWYPVT